MFKNLTYYYKNKLLIPVSAIALILCWFLAFQKTVAEISMHSRLKMASEEKNDLSYSPAYVNNKLNALNWVLSHYRVDSTEYQNEFWLEVSAIASSKGLEVIYQPDLKRIPGDTTRAPLSQSIKFSGEFKGLVQLLDSLEQTPGTGRIVSLTLKKEKGNRSKEDAERIIMTTEFKAIPKL